MTRLFALAQVRLLDLRSMDLKSALRRDEGQTMTEYAVVVGLIIAGLATVLIALWSKITAFFSGLTL